MNVELVVAIWNAGGPDVIDNDACRAQHIGRLKVFVLLMFLACHANRNCEISWTVLGIREELGWYGRDAEKGLAALTAMGMVTESGRDGHRRVRQLPPAHLWEPKARWQRDFPTGNDRSEATGIDRSTAHTGIRRSERPDFRPVLLPAYTGTKEEEKEKYLVQQPLVVVEDHLPKAVVDQWPDNYGGHWPDELPVPTVDEWINELLGEDWLGGITTTPIMVGPALRDVLRRWALGGWSVNEVDQWLHSQMPDGYDDKGESKPWPSGLVVHKLTYGHPDLAVIRHEERIGLEAAQAAFETNHGAS